jgi:AraC-like DNA-binding protein
LEPSVSEQALLFLYEPGGSMMVFDQYLYPELPSPDDDVVVYHSGFCSTLPNYSYGRDIRDYYLIHYITRGKGTYCADSRSYELSANDGFLILPNTPISHKADSKDPWNLCWIAFLGRKAEGLLKQANLDRNHLTFRYDEDDFLETCICNIYNESRERKNTARITGYFYLFIGRLIDNYQDKAKTRKPYPAGFSHFDVAMNYLNRNICTGVTVEELAGHLRLDTSQVYRIFKNHTGCSPQKYITNMRIRRACKLLAKTELPVKDISEWLHFEYQSHFTSLFKKVMKISPTEYRENKICRNDTEGDEMIP